MPKAAIAEVGFGRGTGLASGVIRVFLDRFNLRQKLMLLVAPLLLMMLVLTAQQSWQLAQDNREVARSVEGTQLAIMNSQLVHQLQRERGLTAGYLASGGQAFGSKLQTQRLRTESTLKQHSQLIRQLMGSENDGLAADSVVGQLQKPLARGLLERAALVNRIDQQATGVDEVIAFYTRLNQTLLAANLAYARQSNQPVLLRHLIAYDRLLQAKELAGIERALLSSSLSKKKFSAAEFQKFLTLVSGQETQLTGFEQLLLDDEQAGLKQLMMSSDFKAVTKFRQLVVEQHDSGELQVTPNHWFRLATARIDRLKLIEEQFANAIPGLNKLGIGKLSL